MSYVCAYSSVQLDKSRVEKEFTYENMDVWDIRLARYLVVFYYLVLLLELAETLNGTRYRNRTSYCQHNSIRL